MLAAFTGRCNGVEVKYSASGEVLHIDVTAEGRALYEDEKKVVQRVDDLTAAIKGAIFDAARQVRLAKEELYRQSFTMNRELDKVANNKLWYARDAASLPPHPWESIKDAASKLHEAATRNSVTLAPVCAGPVPLPSNGGFVGASRNVSGVASTHRVFAPALLFLDPTTLPSPRPHSKAPLTADEITSWQQRTALEDQERYFWRRVDLIRRAQINVIGGTRKRGYAKNSETPTERAGGTAFGGKDFIEKVELKFVN